MKIAIVQWTNICGGRYVAWKSNFCNFLFFFFHVNTISEGLNFCNSNRVTVTCIIQVQNRLVLLRRPVTSSNVVIMIPVSHQFLYDTQFPYQHLFRFYSTRFTPDRWFKLASTSRGWLCIRIDYFLCHSTTKSLQRFLMFFFFFLFTKYSDTRLRR